MSDKRDREVVVVNGRESHSGPALMIAAAVIVALVLVLLFAFGGAGEGEGDGGADLTVPTTISEEG